MRLFLQGGVRTLVSPALLIAFAFAGAPGLRPVAAQQSGSKPSKPAAPPSRTEVFRGAANGPANAGAPFEIRVTGAKSATVTGNDASFCMSAGPIKDSQIFALSLVTAKWAISLSALRPLPGVGRHELSGDMMEGIMADLIDKTTGTEPAQWVHRTVESGTLTVTASSPTRLSGTFEMRAKVESGAALGASGKFDAQATRC